MSYDIWVYQAERAERTQPSYRRRSYVFTQMQGPHAFLPQFLIRFHRVDTPADMQAYISRIGGISRALDQLLVRAKLAAAEGVRPPRFAYEGVLGPVARPGERCAVRGRPGMRRSGRTRRREIDTLLKAGKIDAPDGRSAPGRRPQGAARQLQARLRGADCVDRTGHEECRRAGTRRRLAAAGARVLQEALASQRRRR